MSIRSNVSRLREGMSRSTVASAVPLILIIAAGSFLSYRSHAILRQDRDMVVHTYQVLQATREALLAAEDAETSQRGFIITGDPAFLPPLEKARKQTIPASIADLERLLIRDQGQQKRLARLCHLIDKKFDEIRTTIDTRRNRNFDAARILIENRKSREVMDEIRAVVSQMDYQEQRLLRERSGRVAASEVRILWTAAMMAVISIAARIFMAIRALRRTQEGAGSSLRSRQPQV